MHRLVESKSRNFGPEDAGVKSFSHALRGDFFCVLAFVGLRTGMNGRGSAMWRAPAKYAQSSRPAIPSATPGRSR
jgi:hypothetical protein